MKIELDNYNAITIMAFLMEFKNDFKNREDCTTIRGAIKEFSDAVCMQLPEAELHTIIDGQLKADEILGWVPDTKNKR